MNKIFLSAEDMKIGIHFGDQSIVFSSKAIEGFSYIKHMMF